MKIIDNFLNNITMYKLVLYVLLGLLVIAEIFTFFHLLPFSPFSLFFSTVFLVGICLLTNKILAFLFHVPANVESVYISALILALIITPQSIPFLLFAALFTIASKYVVNFNKKHIFNPVAFGIFFGEILTKNFASWWIGTAILMPFVVIGGFLIVRKIRREDMVFTFLVVAVLTIFGFDIANKTDLLLSFKKILLDTPILFFASVMVTEPLTTPPTRLLQNIYGGIIGVLYSPQIHIGTFYTTPESALLLGNIFSYLVSPKVRLSLLLKEREQVTKEIYNFIFSTSQHLSFQPGQYMEWTLQHKNTDIRGNRRYFTIASSPTEKEIILGVRINKNGSSFKNKLTQMGEKEKIIASHIAGDFILPKDKMKKLVFVAGGIGITPFRSMVKYLLDKDEKRDIVLVYTAKNPDEFLYKDIFDLAAKKLNIKVIYTITDMTNNFPHWNGQRGRVSGTLIQKEIPDFMERVFYLSGPNAMVVSFTKILKEVGVKNIIKDYFPGFA